MKPPTANSDPSADGPSAAHLPFTNPRHPPNFEMSSAPSPPPPRRETPALVPVVESECADPQRGGIAATKWANAAGGSDPDLHRDLGAFAGRDAQQAGLAGLVLGSAYSENPAWSAPRAPNSAPSALSSPLSGRPDRCAPTTASSMRSWPARRSAQAAGRGRSRRSARRRPRGRGRRSPRSGRPRPRARSASRSR